MLNYLNHCNSAADCPISLKFCVVTHKGSPNYSVCQSMEPEVEFHRQSAFVEFRFGDISLLPIKMSSPDLVGA